MTPPKPLVGLDLNKIEKLSDREREVLEYLGCGYTSRQIGEALGISSKTVQVYREHIKHKFGLGNCNLLLRVAVLYAEARVQFTIDRRNGPAVSMSTPCFFNRG